MCSGQKNSLESWFWSSREGWIVNINVLFLIIYRVDGRHGTSAVGSYLILFIAGLFKWCSHLSPSPSAIKNNCDYN